MFYFFSRCSNGNMSEICYNRCNVRSCHTQVSICSTFLVFLVTVLCRPTPTCVKQTERWNTITQTKPSSVAYCPSLEREWWHWGQCALISPTFFQVKFNLLNLLMLVCGCEKRERSIRKRQRAQNEERLTQTDTIIIPSHMKLYLYQSRPPSASQPADSLWHCPKQLRGNQLICRDGVLNRGYKPSARLLTVMIG